METKTPQEKAACVSGEQENLCSLKNELCHISQHKFFMMYTCAT